MCIVGDAKGGFSGGTIASGMNIISSMPAAELSGENAGQGCKHSWELVLVCMHAFIYHPLMKVLGYEIPVWAGSMPLSRAYKMMVLLASGSRAGQAEFFLTCRG